MPRSPSLKLALKRGALVAAANWHVTGIQATADWLFKALVAMPLVGAIFLVGLVVGAEPMTLLSLGWRDLVATTVASLLSRPIVLAAFVTSLAVAILGGSAFVFLVKAGTVGILVRGDSQADTIEHMPLRPEHIGTAAAFRAETFVETAWALFPRYAQLGAILVGAYALSGGVFLFLAFTELPESDGWTMTALLTTLLVTWLTVVNLLYLLLQIVVAADDCSVATAVRRVTAFLRRKRGEIAAVFAVVLALVIASTGASLVATFALGLISFVPLFGIAVLPLQLLAWVMRGVIFQFIDITSIGAYLHLYRESPPGVLVSDGAAGPTVAAEPLRHP